MQKNCKNPVKYANEELDKLHLFMTISHIPEQIGSTYIIKTELTVYDSCDIDKHISQTTFIKPDSTTEENIKNAVMVALTSMFTDTTKYLIKQDKLKKTAEQLANDFKPDLKCVKCGKTIKDVRNTKTGEIIKAQDFFTQSHGLCAECYAKCLNEAQNK